MCNEAIPSNSFLGNHWSCACGPDSSEVVVVNESDAFPAAVVLRR